MIENVEISPISELNLLSNQSSQMDSDQLIGDDTTTQELRPTNF